MQTKSPNKFMDRSFGKIRILAEQKNIGGRKTIRDAKDLSAYTS